MAPAPRPTDDPVLACKNKLYYFRIKELKDVLHQLGLSKQGRKQDLLNRVIALLSDEHDQVSKMNGLPKKKMDGKKTVVKIIDDTFRKMQYPASTVAASKSQIESGQNVEPTNKSVDSARLDVKVRCPCGTSMTSDSMIKCDDPQCDVWQHAACVIISEKPADSILPELPPHFYCEMCRITRADPFWVTINHPLRPLSMAPSNILEDGSYTVQYVDKTFPLSRANREMLQKDEYDLQVWCILLNDKVPFRMHWPLHSDMQVNGIPVRVSNRQATQQLGANGRDDGLVLTPYLREGPNKIVFSKIDSRTFCMGVRIAKRRSLEEVLNLVPKEQDGEKFSDAVARVRRCVGGGTDAGNADSDSDIEVVADSVSVSLRCPLTGSRIKIAGRFKPCVHMGGFDLEAFVELNQRSRKWQCPICLKNYSLDDIIIDPYFNRITSLVQSYDDAASEIDVKPDGSWRIKGAPELKDLSQWHSPDGTLCSARDIGSKLNMSVVKDEIKEEPLPEEFGSLLKLGIRKNNNGQWEISKRGDFALMPSPDDDDDQKGNIINENCVTLASNADHKNIEDGINLEQGQFDHTKSNVHDLDSSPVDIIVLSDSDDDNVMELSPSAANCGSTHNTESTFLPNPPETSGMRGEQPAGHADETSFLGFNEGFGDLGLSFWEYPLSPRDNLGEAQKYPANHQPLHEQGSGYNLGVAAAAVDLLKYGHDGGLQACTSSERDGSMGQANMDGRSEICHDGNADKWTSLSLGGADESLIHAQNASQKRMNTGGEIAASDASVLRSGNDGGLSGEIPGGPCSPDWPQRSVRPRLILTIDSDSD